MRRTTSRTSTVPMERRCLLWLLADVGRAAVVAADSVDRAVVAEATADPEDADGVAGAADGVRAAPVGREVPAAEVKGAGTDRRLDQARQ